jgi:hypothetical protein
MGAPPTFEKINAGCTEKERERDTTTTTVKNN